MTGTGSVFRVETDGIGQFDVPAQAPFGIQTQRSLQLYPQHGARRFSDYPQLLEAMLRVKKAAALTNVSIGALAPAFGAAIVDSADRLLSNPTDSAFPVHAFHGGGGISFNMNLNEVIANLANKHAFSAAFGSYLPIHPNDHVNLNHSTSDCFSTACHIAARQALSSLCIEIQGVIDDLAQLGVDWSPLRKLARTCLQDAVDIDFQDYLGGVAGGLRLQLARILTDAETLREVNLGGNIIGRAEDCDPQFFADILTVLNADLARAGLLGNVTRASNLFTASQSHDALLSVATSLEQLARGLIRFAKDLRLMASGPNGGLSEIYLPARQAGSSAIPGKINPTIPEFMVQCGMVACGHAAAIAMTQDHGELDYNPWQAVVITNLLDMIMVLESGVSTLRRNCIQGMRPNVARNTENATSMLPSLIRLKQLRGYSFAAEIAKQADGDLAFVRRVIGEAEAN